MKCLKTACVLVIIVATVVVTFTNSSTGMSISYELADSSDDSREFAVSRTALVVYLICSWCLRVLALLSLVGIVQEIEWFESLQFFWFPVIIQSFVVGATLIIVFEFKRGQWYLTADETAFIYSELGWFCFVVVAFCLLCKCL